MDLYITCPGTKGSLQKLGHTAKMVAMLVLCRSNWNSGCHGNIYVLMVKKIKTFLL